MPQGVPLKETALNHDRVTGIAGQVKAVHPPFDERGFVDAVMADLPSLELKARISCVADAFARFLPPDFAEAARVLVASLPPHDDQTFSGSDFGLYTYAPHSDFVARHGCRAEVVSTALATLHETTKHFTAEDAMRYFINAFPTETMDTILRWSHDDDYHVRRLASEATRPILPWSQRITIDPVTAIPILDNLYRDTHRFVTQSVANHLNDISRSDPSLVLATLARWREAGDQKPREREFIAKTALRTLVKSGYPGAFEFFGINPVPAVTVSGLCLRTHSVALGTALGFEFVMAAKEPETVVVDLVVDFPRKSGVGRGETVYKFRTLRLDAGESVRVPGSQILRVTAGRRLVPGQCVLHVQVNGSRVAAAAFELTDAQFAHA